MTYSKIINPETGKKIAVKSKLGKRILRKYLSVLKGGAAFFGQSPGQPGYWNGQGKTPFGYPTTAPPVFGAGAAPAVPQQQQLSDHWESNERKVLRRLMPVPPPSPAQLAVVQATMASAANNHTPPPGGYGTGNVLALGWANPQAQYHNPNKAIFNTWLNTHLDPNPITGNADALARQAAYIAYALPLWGTPAAAAPPSAAAFVTHTPYASLKGFRHGESGIPGNNSFSEYVTPTTHPTGPTPDYLNTTWPQLAQDAW